MRFLFYAYHLAVKKQLLNALRPLRDRPIWAGPRCTGQLRLFSFSVITFNVSRKRQQYQGYTIEATSFPLRDVVGYTVHYNLIKDEGSHIDDTQFESGVIFASDADAIDGGFSLGKQIIDGGFTPTKIITNKSCGEPHVSPLMPLPNLDPHYANNFIDANALHITGGPEDTALEEILRLSGEDDTFTLLLPHSVKSEIEHPNTPTDVKRRAARLVFSMPVQLTAPEMATHETIRSLIQGNAKPGQHDTDAFHLVESAKYGRHFITNDTRLLRKAAEIWETLHLKVLRPSEFLAAYLQHVQQRSHTP